MTDTQKSYDTESIMYDTGRDAGFDALIALTELRERFPRAAITDGLAGLMAFVMSAAYAMTPDEETAEELIAFSREAGLELYKWRDFPNYKLRLQLPNSDFVYLTKERD